MFLNQPSRARLAEEARTTLPPRAPRAGAAGRLIGNPRFRGGEIVNQIVKGLSRARPEAVNK